MLEKWREGKKVRSKLLDNVCLYLLIKQIQQMDRQSPTSIRYSYSNSSATDSVGISRSLERSGNNISSGALSARLGGVYDYSNNDIGSVPILEHPSQSANSSSIPSQYMNESTSTEVQRNNYLSQSRSQNQANSSQNNQQAVRSSPMSMSSLDRHSYQLQIQELKLMLNQQNRQLQQHEQLSAKYQRCIEQMNMLYQQNDELRSALHNKKADLGPTELNPSYLQSSKNSDSHKIKQEQIRRLKDSIIVLQKQKDSYQEEGNQLSTRIHELEIKNDQYQNKIVLISHEIERLNRLIKQKAQQKVQMSIQNQAQHAQITRLKYQIQSLTSLATNEQSRKSSEYTRKFEELYKEIQKQNDVKISLQAEIRKLGSENRNKQQQYAMQIQKQRLEANMMKRQFEELELKNNRLQEELRSLYEKNNSSQLQLSNVSTETSKLQSIIKQLEEKLKMLEREYQIQVQKIANFNHQNEDLRSHLKLVEEELKRTRNQYERSQQQSIQLRRKIQEISVASQRENLNLGENIKQRQLALKELDRILKDNQIRIHELQHKNRELFEKCRTADMRSHQLEFSLKQTESKVNESARTIQNQQAQIQQYLSNMKQKDARLRQVEQNYQNCLKSAKQWENKHLLVYAELEKNQLNHAGFVNQKNIEEAKQRDVFRQQLSELEERLNFTNSQKNELQLKYEQSARENAKLQQDIQSQRATKAEVQNKLKMTQSSLELKNKEVLFLEQSYSSLENEFKSQITLTKEVTIKLNKQNQTQKTEYFKEMNRKEASIFELQHKIQEMQAALNRYQQKNQEKDQFISQQASKIEKEKQQSLRVQHQLDNTRSDNTHLVQELQYLKQSYLTKEKAFVQAREQLAATLNEKQAKLNEKNQEVWVIQNQMNKIVERYRQLQKQYQSARENNIKSNAESKNYVQINRVLDREYKESQERIRSKQKEINELKQVINEAEKRHRKIQKEQNEALQSIQKLQKHKQYLQEQISTLRNEFGNKLQMKERQVNENKVVINQLQEKAREFEIRYKQMCNQYELQHSRVQDTTLLIQSQYKPLEHEHRSLEQQHRQLEAKLRQQETRNRQIEFENKQLEQRKIEAQRQAAAVETQCSRLEQECRILEQQLSQCRAETQRVHEQNFELQQNSHESIISIQNAHQKTQQEAQQYKDTISTLSNRYRNLEQEHGSLKQKLSRLQQYHTDIEARSNILETQLKGLQQKYAEMINASRATDIQLNNMRQVIRKTQQERVFLQDRREQEDKYYQHQLHQRENIIAQLRHQLGNLNRKQTQYEEMLHRMESKINIVEHQQIQSTSSHQQQVVTLEQALQTSNATIASHLRKIHELTEDNINFVKECQNLQNLLNEQREKVGTLENQLRGKQEHMKQMQQVINSYMSQINALTSQINMLSEQLTQSRFTQNRQVQNLMTQKNGKIQQLQRQLIERQDHFRREIEKKQIEQSNARSELMEKAAREYRQKYNKQESIINALQKQLEHESGQYENIASKLQQFLSVNQHNFEAILHKLEKVLQLNTQLMVEISKSNMTIINVANNQSRLAQEHFQNQMREMGKFRSQSMNALSELKEIADHSRDDGQNRRRMERKDRQDSLEREQRIIKYIQQEKEKGRMEREYQQRNHKQLTEIIEQANRASEEQLQQLTHKLRQTIKEQVSNIMQQNNAVMKQQEEGAKRSIREKQQNMLRESRNSNKFIHELTGNIVSKMENLTNLFMQSHVEYKNNMNYMQENIRRLEDANENLRRQIQVNEDKHIRTVQQHNLQKQTLQQQLHQEKYRVSLTEHQLQQTNIQNTNRTTHQNENINRTIKMMEAQLERTRIENNQMRNQYDMIVTQYEKTNASLNRELEIARNEIQRLTVRFRQKEREEVLAPSRNQTKNSTNSKNSSNKNSTISEENHREVIQKYEDKIHELAQQIQRLHRIIDMNQKEIGKLSSNTRISEVLHIETELKYFQSQLLKKVKQNEQLKSQISALSFQSQVNRSTNTNQIQLMELRHQLVLLQQENQNLQTQADKSVATIKNLMQKVEVVKKSYRDMAEYAESIQNKVLGLYSKYNDDLIKKSSYEDSTLKMNEAMVGKIQIENKSLREKLHNSQLRNEEMKQQFNKMDNIIEGLKLDNLGLRKQNYEYQVQFEKIKFMQQKIGKLNNEVDRISEINVQLNKEVSECRFAMGDQATLERRLFESYLTIILISAEVESLRSRLGEKSREASKDSKDGHTKQTTNILVGSQRSKLIRVKSEEGVFKFQGSTQGEQMPVTNQRLGNYYAAYRPATSQIRNDSLSGYKASQPIKITKPPNRHMDANLSNLLRSPSRDKSRNKSSSRLQF